MEVYTQNKYPAKEWVEDMNRHFSKKSYTWRTDT